MLRGNSGWRVFGVGSLLGCSGDSGSVKFVEFYGIVVFMIGMVMGFWLHFQLGEFLCLVMMP